MLWRKIIWNRKCRPTESPSTESIFVKSEYFKKNNKKHAVCGLLGDCFDRRLVHSFCSQIYRNWQQNYHYFLFWENVFCVSLWLRSLCVIMFPRACCEQSSAPRSPLADCFSEVMFCVCLLYLEEFTTNLYTETLCDYVILCLNLNYSCIRKISCLNETHHLIWASCWKHRIFYSQKFLQWTFVNH